MSTTSIVVGILLIIVGVVGYVNASMSDKASVTALIPAFFGIVIALLGAIALVNESLRKHLMHGAVALALIGFILTAGRLASKYSELTMSPAVMSQLAMALICLVFVILAIRSFAIARRNM